MTTDTTTNRAIFETYNADPRFVDVRRIRSQLAAITSVLRGNIQSYQQGTRELTPANAQSIREYVLRMMQLENAMVEACETLPAEFAEVKTRILADFDTEQPRAYLAKVNGWLRLVEGAV